MTLRKEYQDIVDSVTPSTVYMATRNGVQGAVERCQAIADKQPIQLTSKELSAIERTYLGSEDQDALDLARAYIAAHIAKQKEPLKPKTMQFRAAQFGDSSPVVKRHDAVLPPKSRWVSKIIEVTIEEQS